MLKNYKKKRKLNGLKTSLLLLLLMLFANVVQAQSVQNRNILMQNGSTTLTPDETINFYDSHGPSHASIANGNKMEINYWDRWYANDEANGQGFTYTFNAPAGKDVKVVFKKFMAYGETEDGDYQSVPPVAPYNCAEIGEWTLRVNDDWLYAYEGTVTLDSKLIGAYTGNTQNEFSIIAHGAITFKFVSNSLFREEGWAAEVTVVEPEDFAPTAPFIRRSTCSDQIELVSTTLGSALYYSTGSGTTPSIPYNDTPIDWPADNDLVVNAMAILGGVNSNVATATFDDENDRLITIDDDAYAPTIERVEGENKMSIYCPKVPQGLNETFFVSYTTGTSAANTPEPSRTVGDKVYFTYVALPGVPMNSNTYYSGNDRTYVFDWETPNTYFKAKVFAFSCHNDEMESPVATAEFSNVFIPKPVINVTGTYNQQTNPNGVGSGTITCSLDDATIYYTLDGSEPTTSSQLHGTGTINLADVAPGTTIKAMAYVDSPGYTSSPVVSFLYVPTGSDNQPQNGVYGSVVMLDDREDHSWSYYSDGDQPIHSLNPADVKITYFGNGITMKNNNNYTANTSTNDYETSSGVAVGVEEKARDANRFIYLKTLENEKTDGTGTKYPYTTIPNPFSKRPIYGTVPTNNVTSFSGWRGFQGWRVKSINGGSIGYNVGDIIPAETAVDFQPTSEYGMEVEFEAVWARAYVATDRSTALSGGSYERNFYVLTGNIGNNNIASPGTVSRYYPNGTTNGRDVATTAPTATQNISNVSLSVDTKYEYIALSWDGGDNYLTANNHYLCFGRGISTGQNAARVRGMGGGSNAALNYMLRLESGRFDAFGFIGNENWTMSNRVLVKAILGSDYDRANNDNSKLEVSRNSSMFYSTGGVDFSNASNMDQKVFDCVVKSGTYQSQVTNDGAYDHSLYCGHNSASAANDQRHYPGVRYVTVEGGSLASLNGGRATDGWNDPTYTHDAVCFSARIKGGTFRGSVYGGAADNPSGGSKQIIITGGTIQGWVAGGANGTGSVGGSHATTNGNSYIYVGGNSTIGSTNPPTINETPGGNVFGAGRGRSAQMASIDISNVVVADNTTIYQNVYGGGYNGTIRNTSNVYVLGGTVKQNVFGGAYGNDGSVTATDLGGTVSKDIPASNVYVRGGEVQGSVYGGSNDRGTVNNSHVNMMGGKATDVFGGGKGGSTVIGANTTVVFAGGETGNVYGGGEFGTVGTTSANGNTDVTFSGGTVQDIFGAGLGTKNTTDVTNPTNPTANANIYGNTHVTINGGTVSGSVFGGGENGSVAIGVNNKKSTVAIVNGTVNGSVFGGGSEGFTNGATVVNVSGGVVKGSVFGGAYGTDGIVYITGTHTINVLGNDNGIPEIDGSVYGGSRLANDGDSFTIKKSDFANSQKNQLSSVVNISGGRIREHVYAAGYYGQCFGSVYVNIGSTAIENTTAALGNNTADKLANRNRIFIEGTVWAGGDWGVFDGNFGGPTITGHSNVVVDGTDYNVTSNTYTVSEYMGIGMSILGCGTSGDAGKQNRNLLLRNYGKPVTAGGNTVNPVSSATRELLSIQRFKNVTFDNSHVNFTGQGKVNSLNTTEKYSLYSIVNDTHTGNVYVGNGSTLVMNKPSSELNSFRSVTCRDVYATPIYAEVTRNALYNSALNGLSDNKIRVNGGSYVEVKYLAGTTQTYGELQGFFHMMSSNTLGEATCAYARPKQATDSHIADGWDNPNDGGFLSYDTQYNTWDAAGKYIGASNYQLPYENHVSNNKADSQYFRIWEFGGNHHSVDGIITVQQVLKPGDQGYQEYHTVDVTIQLPAWRTRDSYYRFDRVGNTGSYFTNIDYGIDVMAFNAAHTTDGTGNNWMYFDETTNAQVSSAASSACPEISMLGENPDMNFGLIIMPGKAMKPAADRPENFIICSSSDSYIAETMQYNCYSYNAMPTVTFRLTYKNSISSNTTWDPITIPLVQCSSDGTETEYVNVYLTVKTMTEITSDFKTQVYAIMNNGSNTHATTLQTVVLPTFTLDSPLTLSNFKLVKAEFTPGEALNGGTTVTYESKTNQDLDINSFGLTMEAVLTPDNSDDWRAVEGEIDAAPGNGSSLNMKIAESGGRMPVALGFHLYYSEVPQVQDVTKMGTVVFTVEFDNYKNGDGNHKGQFTVTVDVYRKGSGTNFYVDGVHGKDEIDNEHLRGRYPNFAAKSVEYVLSRLGYTAGDNIFIVNTVDVKKALRYDGSKKQDNVNIWRYPGNHSLKTSADGSNPTPISGNAYNEAFKGLLFDLKSGAQLSVIGCKIDGMYAEAVAQTHDQHIFPTQNLQEGAVVFNGLSEAPIFKVNDGAKLTLNSITSVQNNYNSASSTDGEGDAGGIYVASGGILAMNQNTHITSNYNSTVGGVYMDGSMVVSDDVVVYNNKKDPEGVQSNVWLTKGTDADKYKVVQIGDANINSFGPLTENAHIGIDKDYGSDANTMDYYLPVVFTETANEDYAENYLEAPYQSNRASLTDAMIVHDKGKYRLEKYFPDYYLYWLSTWVTFQDWNPKYESANDPDYDPDDMDYTNIDSPEKLAWFISMVNGENGATPNDFVGETVYIKDDISMDGHIWVPIGTEQHPFKGTFEGNGHVITDMYGSLVQTDMGMFGRTDNATIQNAVMSTSFTGTNNNLGTVIGTMNGGTLCNVEGAGSITNKLDNSNMGGLVGNNVGGTIHSAFAVADLTGGSKMGGLVGKNSGNLYNAYSNVDFAKLDGQTSSMEAGGLVYENTGIIQNCYVIVGDLTYGTFYPFAAKSNGNIDFCYAAQPAEGVTVTYVGDGTQPTTHGTYGEVQPDIKHVDYMFYDNLIAANTNTYVGDEGITSYVDNHTPVWNGLLSTLNQWVRQKGGNYSKWNRPINSAINGDLPVLAFPKDNSMATLNSDGKYLQYSTGLDNLLEDYTEASGIFVYGAVTDVANVPANDNVKVTVAEDAALLQTANAGAFKATVGVTFDNSCSTATDFYGNPTGYDWHFLSSPLNNAPMGITYTGGDNFAHGDNADYESMEGNYMPNNPTCSWDLYSFYEPEYHWINLKRSENNHWHFDDPFDQIIYDQEDIFVPGKGYMAAIEKDSYLNNTGTLNKADFDVDLTYDSHAPGTDELGYNLVGNPYMAYLNMDEFATVNTGFNSYWVYIAENDNYVPGNSLASDNTSLPSVTLHPHQAFFVKASGKNQKVSFKYNMATASPNPNSYYRSEKVNYPLVNLKASNAKGMQDLAVIEFNRPERGGSNKLRALNNADFEICSRMDEEDYSILFTPEGTERVPVRFRTKEDGTFTLTWETMHGDFSSLLLVDNMTGTVTDMLHTDRYTFDASSEDYASRFYITFRVTDVEEYNEGDGTFAWFDGSEWVVDGQGTLCVVDVLGRTLYSERLTSDRNRIGLSGVAKGVYLLRLSDGKDTMVQKIVVK